MVVDKWGKTPNCDISCPFSRSQDKARYPHTHTSQQSSSFDFERGIGYTVVHMRFDSVASYPLRLRHKA